MPFIIANEAFERVASYGLVPNMIVYLMSDYDVGVVKGTNIIFLWSAASNFAPILGAFLSDSYLGPFYTIGLGSLISLLGMSLLWLTAMVPQLKPPPCNHLTQTCKPPTNHQFAFLIIAFMFISLGGGGVKPCSLAFGAKQIDNTKNPNNKRALESFLGWYYVAAMTAVLVAYTAVVYIQDHAGWKLGFGVPPILMLFSVILFFLASSLYVKIKVEKSIFTSFVQVIVVAFKNRKIVDGPSKQWHHHQNDKDSDSVPTKKLRFLNKACIIQDPKDVTPDGVASNPWRLCTIEQVEEVKSLIRVLPLWASGLMMSINISQSTFPVIQAKTMNRHLGSSNFQIPAASYAFFAFIMLAIWVFVYDRIIIPAASKILRTPFCIDVKLRIGIGVAISTLAMVTSAIVEHARRKKAIERGFRNNPHAVINMSAMWLVPQNCLHGLAEALSIIGQNEFYYAELPKSMSSIAASLILLGLALANLLASVILNMVEKLARGSAKEGWIASNINEGHYDRYYWVLAVISFVNFFYYIVCCWAYGPCVTEKVKDECIQESNEDI
ncbi:protein NRT1/ PTR FAMILY 1.2-like [Bidens hawaiensis]|uniref:protein NRT1/ PTR FAMILY 1.2-like n=1 Tax=Bidens hawaiensis TaxID=980011 RepID=UPI00404B5556